MKTWMFIVLIIVLFSGFVMMSLILAQGLLYIKQLTTNFIEVIGG